jgi:hypothetical protein
MGGHTTTKPEIEHMHTKADLILTICSRLVDELQIYATPEGLLDARECLEQALREQALNEGAINVLLGRLYLILDETRKLVREVEGW